MEEMGNNISSSFKETKDNIAQIMYGTNINDINNNPAAFYDKNVSVSGTFYQIGCLDPNYKIVDSQGFQLFVSVPNRDLTAYAGKEVTVEGIVRNKDCSYMIGCCWSFYLELSKIR